MKKSIFILAIIMLFSASLVNKAFSQSLKIVNYSDWTIVNLYVSSSTSDSWGSDKLGDYTLQPNYQYQITLPSGCGYYDAKLIDEDGDECVISEVYLCDDTWEINNDDLLECMGY